MVAPQSEQVLSGMSVQVGRRGAGLIHEMQEHGAVERAASEFQGLSCNPCMKRHLNSCINDKAVGNKFSERESAVWQDIEACAGF